MAHTNTATLIAKLTDIAKAIREKTGDPDTTTYSLDDMVTKIKGLGTSGGGNTGETPIECTHSYVNGVCIKCGEADPNYVPEPDPEPDIPDDDGYVTATVNYVITAKSQPKTIVDTADDDISSVTPIYSGNQATVSTVKGDYIWFLMTDDSRNFIQYCTNTIWYDDALKTGNTNHYVGTIEVTLPDGKKAIYYAYQSTAKGKITNKDYRII